MIEKMSLVSRVEKNVNRECLATRCRKEGCSLTLKDLPRPYLLIDMDHRMAPSESHERNKCDYIFIGDEGNWVVPLELTRGKLEANKVLPQLQAGARVAEEIVPRKARTQFRPIAVYGREFRGSERNKLSQKTNGIHFRGQVMLVRAVRSRSPLVSALSKA